MTLRLVMTRTVDGDEVAEATDDALRPRIARGVMGEVRGDVALFAQKATYTSVV